MIFTKTWFGRWSWFSSLCVCVCVCTQSCPTLCNPIHCSLPGSSLCGTLQARILEQFAISFSRGSSWPRDWTLISWISYTGRWSLYHWVTWEAPSKLIQYHISVFIFVSQGTKACKQASKLEGESRWLPFTFFQSQWKLNLKNHSLLYLKKYIYI